MPSSSLQNDLVKSIGNGKLDRLIGFNKILPVHLQSASLSNVKITKPSSLSQEALQYIEPFRHQYFVNQSLFTIEEREVVIEEFLLLIQEVKYRANLLHSYEVRIITKPLRCYLIN